MVKTRFKIISCLVAIILLVSPVSAGFFDFLFKSGTKQAVKTEKQVVSVQKSSKIEQNALRGAEWERNAEKLICSQRNSFCVHSISDAMTNLRGSRSTYTIVGGKTTKEFINRNKLFGGNYFTKEPDFLEITQTNGRISKIKIVDAKTSPSAVRSTQDSAFKELCTKAIVPCEVDYVMPKANTEFLNAVCIVAFGDVVPDPVDALCLLVAFLN